MSVSETSLSTSTKTYIERIIMSDKSLRSKIIRLAHSKPELRSHLLPLLTKSASDPLTEFLVIDFQDWDGSSKASPEFKKGLGLLRKGERYGIRDFLRDHKNEMHRLVKKMPMLDARRKQILSDMYKY